MCDRRLWTERGQLREPVENVGTRLWRSGWSTAPRAVRLHAIPRSLRLGEQFPDAGVSGFFLSPAKQRPAAATLQGVHVEATEERDDGWREEWLEACERSYPKVYRALVAMGASADAASDAVQDAFERALREDRPAHRPEGWLFVVACRAWKRRRWRERIFRPIGAIARAIDGLRPDGEIDLLVELQRLTERQRAVVVSKYVIGLSQREIAELLDIAPGTVAATAHQATALLRERLTGGRR